jgi:glycosyltransferase involved in cell wall biosynthesis
MKRVPSVVSIDCTQALAGEAASTLERLTYTPNVAHDGMVFRAASAIISVSAWAATDLVRQYPECADKVHVLPYPVRLDFFPGDWAENRRARRANSSASPVEVLFIGGDFPRKGGYDLLDAWRRGGFSQTSRLTLVTDYPLRRDEVPLGVDVAPGILPYTAQWRDMWRRSEVFAMPSRGEAFGMVFQEAAAAGLPSIGTKVGAVSEMIENGRTGILAEPGDPDSLAAALRSLIDNAGRRHEMGIAARRRIETVADLACYGKKLTEVLVSAARVREAIA